MICEYESKLPPVITDDTIPTAKGIEMLISSDFHLIFDVTVKKPHLSVYLYSKMWFLFGLKNYIFNASVVFHAFISFKHSKMSLNRFVN